MIGFKAFEDRYGELWCKTMHYEVGKEYSMECSPIICDRGYHFCKTIGDCYNYYPMQDTTRICKVEALGDIVDDGNNKYCTNKIKILEEITEDYIRKANNNASSSGYCNSGYCNSGYCNSGDCNSGDCNSGDCNSGDRNSGNCNSGDWNSGDYSSGVFNTKEQKIFMFDMPSDWTFNDWYSSEARYILSHCPQSIKDLTWTWAEDMTDEEKKEHPEYETTGGFLKEEKTEANVQKWWNEELSQKERDIVIALPNFDAEIFKSITGIEV